MTHILSLVNTLLNEEERVTIAAAYLTAEGVVLGADSTTTYINANGKQYYNHAQKLFEIGENSTLAAVTWGLGGLSVSSYRTLIALFADSFRSQKPKSVLDAGDKWSKQFWTAYSQSPLLATTFARAKQLSAKAAHDPASLTFPADMRTDGEEQEVSKIIDDFGVGFCLAGYVMPDRTPKAISVFFNPMLQAPPKPIDLPMGPSFWGVPAVIDRTLGGYDPGIIDNILKSKKWNGTRNELVAILEQHRLGIPILPMRDALDFVNMNILNTIKIFKFASSEPVCGGAVELGVITSDRTFRWVRHKPWNSAMGEGNNEQRNVY